MERIRCKRIEDFEEQKPDESLAVGKNLIQDKKTGDLSDSSSDDDQESTSISLTKKDNRSAATLSRLERLKQMS